jgi:hypothetical protein
VPTYALLGNARTDRVAVAYGLSLVFGHADAMGLEITDLSYTKTGPNAGSLNITVTQTLTPEQRAHLGLA